MMRTSRAVFAAEFVNFDRSGPGNTENVQIHVQKWNEITATEGVQRKVPGTPNKEWVPNILSLDGQRVARTYGAFLK